MDLKYEKISIKKNTRNFIIICFALAAILFTFPIFILRSLISTMLFIVPILLLCFAGYDYFKICETYLILNESSISINKGIINGYNIIDLKELNIVKYKKKSIVLYGYKNRKLGTICTNPSIIDKKQLQLILSYLKGHKINVVS